MRLIFIGTISGLFTLFLISGGFAFTSVASDVNELKKEVPLTRERIGKQEEKVEGIDKRLERMENKLDQVIEHVNDEHRRTNRRPDPTGGGLQ